MAREVGYGYRHLDYHESAGNFERVGHGLYRLATVPPAEFDDLIRLTLWSRNQKDEPQAVASHETALLLHGLSDLLPGRIHLTVPPGFRKAAPAGCVLHKNALQQNEIEEREGFRVTAPLRTLLDAAAGSVSTEQLEQAVKDALLRGLVRRSTLEEASKRSPAGARLTSGIGSEAVASDVVAAFATLERFWRAHSLGGAPEE